MLKKYEALLVVSFGGPEGMEEVMPFLDNVLEGKKIPEERKKEVARHYEMFGGVSPINAQNRELISLLKKEFQNQNINLPIYWGNRNWKPYLREAIEQMKKDGVQKALAYITSAYDSYSGNQQYLKNIEEMRTQIGEGAPIIQKLRAFYNHPFFIQANCERIQDVMKDMEKEEYAQATLVFTAHSIPLSMSQNCEYVAQLKEASRLTAERLSFQEWTLVYQSRSGPPTQPWLEPDILSYLKTLKEKGKRTVVVSPIGFVSDHMEVIYDLDCEAKKRAQELGLKFFRAQSVGNHPLFIQMLIELIKERL